MDTADDGVNQWADSAVAVVADQSADWATAVAVDRSAGWAVQALVLDRHCTT